MAVLNRPLFTPTNHQANGELVERLRWVIGIRWAVVATLVLVGIFRYSRPDSLEARAVILGLAVLVLAYNFLYVIALRRPGFGQSNFTSLVRYGQIPIDLIVVTALLHFSGGVTGPVFVLYFLYIFVGLAILPPSGAYWVAAIAALSYGALTLLESVMDVTPPDNALTGARATNVPDSTYLGYFLTVAATLLITAYIANYFAGLLTRDERTIRQQLDQINTQNDVTQKMSSTLNSDEVMRTLITSATQLDRPSSCSLVLFNDKGEGYFGATVGITAEERRQNQLQPFTVENPIVKQAIEERKGIYAPDVNAMPDLRAVLQRAATRSFYSVPMLNDDRVIGSLNLSFDKHYTMPVGHWNLLGALTQQAALALERTRLFTEAERSAREMTGLYHIGLATTSSLQIDEVLRLIYEQVNSVVHPDTFYIGLYDEEQSELTFDIFVENDQFLPPFKSRLEGGISAWVIRNCKPMFVRHWDVEIEQLPFEAGVVGAPTQSVISVPLMAKNKMVGVMSVQSVAPDAFDQDHLRLLTSIAGQAALSLENAKLHALVYDQAQRDSLTGVFNHGTFISKLHDLVSETSTSRQTIALIMLDIDRFKQYNDTYGHLAGDDVLRSIVVAIQDHLKGTDVVGRWGGEEFGIILPDVNRPQARLIAERIRQTAARTTLKDMHDRTIPSPTVSQGLAFFPDDAISIEELLDKADSALYRAKENGRNQIAEWIDLEQEHGPLSFRARG